MQRRNPAPAGSYASLRPEGCPAASGPAKLNHAASPPVAHGIAPPRTAHDSSRTCAAKAEIRFWSKRRRTVLLRAAQCASCHSGPM